MCLRSESLERLRTQFAKFVLEQILAMAQFYQPARLLLDQSVHGRSLLGHDCEIVLVFLHAGDQKLPHDGSGAGPSSLGRFIYDVEDGLVEDIAVGVIEVLVLIR